jgi:tetratricopeptide (TPR) repeat protein
MTDISDILDHAYTIQMKGGERNHQSVVHLLTVLMPEAKGRESELYNFIGISQRMLGEYDAAQDSFIQALSTNVPAQLARAHVGLADIFRVRDADVADAHAQLDLAIDAAVPNSLEQVIIHNQRALVHFADKGITHKQQLAFAEQEYVRALGRCTLLSTGESSRELSKRHADVLYGLAYVYRQMPGKMDDAETLVEEAIGKYRQASDINGLMNTLKELALIRIGQARFAEAIPLLKESYWVTENAVNARAQGSVALSLAEAYARIGAKNAGRQFFDVFSERALDGSLTQHDLIVHEDQIARVKSLYQD